MFVLFVVAFQDQCQYHNCTKPIVVFKINTMTTIVRNQCCHCEPRNLSQVLFREDGVGNLGWVAGREGGVGGGGDGRWINRWILDVVRPVKCEGSCQGETKCITTTSIDRHGGLVVKASAS